ncbi:Proteolipid protein 2 [Tilletia horrida]|uniref:Proteolipid protein 2 n=1 Tax=Tilletia horrida TaxID=155126 RepID=A0AAN6GL80_9BASI|nr:Proteolipid protein 2 [Tilletia horrida]KAK0562562.1 Proteolipid protein 2 [Tilletia horrida]
MAQVQVDPTEDTEFHDALRRHGIIPPKPPSRSPSPDLPSASERRTDTLHSLPQSQIDALLEGETVRRTDRTTLKDDDDDDALLKLDEDDDEERKLLLRLREERMAQLRVKEKRARFGRVYPISRVDYTREVTEASKQDPHRPQGADTGPEGETSSSSKGTSVVCYLYKDGMETCKLLGGYLDTLAAKHPSTKFVSIVGDKCIPNYPDRNLPTLLIYKNGDLHRQIVGLRPEIGLDGMNTKLADVELLLTAVGAIERPNPSKADANESTAMRDQEDDEDGSGAGRTRGIRHGGIGAGTGASRSTVRTQEEEDADLDWDL